MSRYLAREKYSHREYDVGIHYADAYVNPPVHTRSGHRANRHERESVHRTDQTCQNRERSSSSLAPRSLDDRQRTSRGTTVPATDEIAAQAGQRRTHSVDVACSSGTQIIHHQEPSGIVLSTVAHLVGEQAHAMAHPRLHR